MKLSHQPETYLLTACQQGSQAAYEEIFTRYSIKLFKFALKYTKDDSIAEEIMMDVMFQVWEHRGKLNEIQHFPSYLFAATKNKVFNHFRKKALETFSLENVANTISADYSTDLPINMEDLQQHYIRSLDLLSPQCKAVFTLSRQEDLTYAEISQQLNISIKTVEGHITNALKSLRKSMVLYSESILFLVLSFFF